MFFFLLNNITTLSNRKECLYELNNKNEAPKYKFHKYLQILFNF